MEIPVFFSGPIGKPAASQVTVAFTPLLYSEDGECQ